MIASVEFSDQLLALAGGVLLKAGFFKALLVGLAALWKPIAAGVVLLGGGIARYFRRGARIKPDA